MILEKYLEVLEEALNLSISSFRKELGVLLSIATAAMRVCHKSVTHPLLIFCLFTDTKSLKNIFIYNKAQTFTSSGFVFPQKKCIFAENFFKYGKDTNKI